jgi:hypothetical protein
MPRGTRRITAGQGHCHSNVTPGTVNYSRPGGSYGRQRRGRWPQQRAPPAGTTAKPGRAGAPPHSRSGPRRIHPCAASRQTRSGGRQVPRYGRRRRRSGHRRRRTGPWPTGRREMDTRPAGTRGTVTRRTDTRGTDTPGTDTRGTDTPGMGTRGPGTQAAGTRGPGSRHATGSRRALGTRRVTGGGQETTDGGLIRSRTILIRPRLAPRMKLCGPHGDRGRKVSARGVPVIQRVRRLPACRPPQVQGLSARLPQNGARKG